jgi:S1-C subfamily serine protease
MQKENKNLIVTVVISSIIISSVFGAGAGFLATSGGFSSVPQVQSLLRKFWPQSNFRSGGVEQRTVQVQEESAVTSAVEKVSPAVVSIIVSKDLPKLEQYYYNPFGNDPFFNDFFGGSGNQFLVPGTRQNGTEKQEVGGGTGFVITNDGMIVTNKHVVTDEEAEYTVLMNDEKKYPAKVLARDAVNDLAILKIEAKDLPTVELGDSGNLKVGQSVIAIGNALGEFRNTVSVGVISGLARSITAGGAGTAEELTNVIQTDAAINSGNSGGPLLNIAGQVIGINTAVAQGAQGIGFAIPINEVKNSIEAVQKTGKISRPWLGVRYVMLTADIAKQNNLSITEGALVVRGDTRTDLAVIPGSPADKAGITENDIILEINGQKINNKNLLANALSKFKPGDDVTFKVWHKGETKDVKVKLEEYKNS